MQHWWQQRAAAATTSTLLTDMIKCCLGLLFCLLLSHSVYVYVSASLSYFLSLSLSRSLLVCLHCHVLQCSSTPDRPLVPYQMKVYKLMLPSFLAAWLGLFPAAAQEQQRFASCTNNLQAEQRGINTELLLLLLIAKGDLNFESVCTGCRVESSRELS